MTEPTNSGPGDLSFDKAIPAAAAAGAVVPGVKCANCGKAISDVYHTVNGLPICENCRAILEKASAGVTEPQLILKAFLYGLGAAIAGAFVYWVVAKATGYELALITILIGWMIGKAMHAATGGRGGRVLQVLGVVLVYLAVSASHLPFILEGASESVSAGLLVFALAIAPLASIFGTGVGGILSAIILGVGMIQAWRQTGVLAMDFQGPFRVGAAAS